MSSSMASCAKPRVQLRCGRVAIVTRSVGQAMSRMTRTTLELTATTAQQRGIALDYAAIPAGYPYHDPFDFRAATVSTLFATPPSVPSMVDFGRPFSREATRARTRAAARREARNVRPTIRPSTLRRIRRPLESNALPRYSARMTCARRTRKDLHDRK